MPVTTDTSVPPAPGAAVRVAAARTRADARLAGAIADFFLPDDSRLDDRARAALARLLTGVVGAIETELRRQAARLLATRGAGALAETLLAAPEGAAVERLTRAGLLRDRALMDELIARVRHDLLADALPTGTGPDDREAGGEGSSLLVRLAAVPDRVVAAAAAALLVADSRRRGDSGASELPAELHHRLVWWIAAAIRPTPANADADRAIAEAAARSLAAHDEGERADAVAARLAAAIDARPDELAPLLIEALGDRRLSLFAAVLGHALGLDSDEARAIVIEAEGEQLWLALRAASLGRATIAQVALALADADPRRDIEAFADRLDQIAAVDPAEARAALAPATLGRDFRGAIAALARGRTR